MIYMCYFYYHQHKGRKWTQATISFVQIQCRLIQMQKRFRIEVYRIFFPLWTCKVPCKWCDITNSRIILRNSFDGCGKVHLDLKLEFFNLFILCANNMCLFVYTNRWPVYLSSIFIFYVLWSSCTNKCTRIYISFIHIPALNTNW